MNYEHVMNNQSNLPPVPLRPPRGAEVEGVFRDASSVHDQKIIYTETVLDVPGTKASARPKLDEKGNEVWKRSVSGEPLYQILVKDVKYKTIRYVLQEMNGRHVKRVYHFEMTPEERAEIERREAEANFFKEFVRESSAAGISAAELVQVIKRQILGDEPEDSVEIDVTEEAIAAMQQEILGEDLESELMASMSDGEALGDDEAPPPDYVQPAG